MKIFMLIKRLRYSGAYKMFMGVFTPNNTEEILGKMIRLNGIGGVNI